jgi:hypothetical protein
MADQDAKRGSFWSSLPGVLTGAAALISAISGLAIWHHQSNPPRQRPAPIVHKQQSAGANPVAAPIATTSPATPIGSDQWCEEKYTAWKAEKAQSGVDDAALRKQIIQAQCNQFGIKLGRIKGQSSP